MERYGDLEWARMPRRHPKRSTLFNNASSIDRYLCEDNHTIWGLAIYRTCYTSDTDWNRFLQLFLAQTRRSLGFDGGLDLMDNLSLPVFDDKDAFNNASTHQIRKHFRNWSDLVPEMEQGSGCSAAMSQRYHYCIQVDAVALKSILSETHSDPEADRTFIAKGFVNLIWKDWEPDWPSAEDVFEPLEGNTSENVGWMRVRYQSLLPCYYRLLRDWDDAWYREYRRPPFVQQP